MTILFITHYPGFYGANKSLLTLILILRKKYGVKPLVLLPSNGPMCNELQKEGIGYKVSHYYWWVNYNHGAFQWLLNKRKQLRNWMRVGKFCKLFKDEQIDLIYTNSICVNMGFLMARRLRLPHIWQARESLVQFSLSLSLSLSLSIWSSRVNRKYILISDYMMNYYRQYLPHERMVRIYNGVDLPGKIDARKTNVVNGRLKIACVGVMTEQKNQMELLKAQASLKNRGIEVETFFLGSNNEAYLKQMLRYVEENHLDDLAHIIGHTDEVFDVLREMNLGVVCADGEAFGRVTIEFLLMHMPVVVADSGANTELVEPGLTGMAYELGDVEALAQAIKAYVERPDLLEEQGARAEQKAKEEFSAGRNAQLIFEQIKDVLNK